MSHILPQGPVPRDGAHGRRWCAARARLPACPPPLRHLLRSFCVANEPCNRCAGAREWVEAHAAEHPELAAALEDGSAMKRARAVTFLWKRATETRVTNLRKSTALRTLMNKSHILRTFTGLTRAVVSKHETVRACVHVRGVVVPSRSGRRIRRPAFPASCVHACLRHQ
jgi:hypothetical protein